jgi:tetraacyldisaccharide 4'-kinase
MNFVKPKFWDKNQVSFLSILLLPLTLIIQLIIFFRKKITKKYSSNIPVICVGNIYLGGTGKTPMCIELFSILKNLKKNPAFVRKMYDSFQDEADLQKKVGPVYQNKKRIFSINEAIKSGADVAILDDGFQDFSIKKNLSIICFNEKQWIGNGFTIPSGPLRESLSALKRADLVCINGKKNTTIENKILFYNKKVKIYYIKYKLKDVDKIKNKKVIAFAGIGNPENFFDLLKDNNIKIEEEIKFPDHFNYSIKNLENLINKASATGSILLTTEKDFVRINKNNKSNINFLKIRVEIENQNQFIEEIKTIL